MAPCRRRWPTPKKIPITNNIEPIAQNGGTIERPDRRQHHQFDIHRIRRWRSVSAVRANSLAPSRAVSSCPGVSSTPRSKGRSTTRITRSRPIPARPSTPGRSTGSRPGHSVEGHLRSVQGADGLSRRSGFLEGLVQDRSVERGLPNREESEDCGQEGGEEMSRHARPSQRWSLANNADTNTAAGLASFSGPRVEPGGRRCRGDTRRPGT